MNHTNNRVVILFLMLVNVAFSHTKCISWRNCVEERQGWYSKWIYSAYTKWKYFQNYFFLQGWQFYHKGYSCR